MTSAHFFGATLGYISGIALGSTEQVDLFSGALFLIFVGATGACALIRRDQFFLWCALTLLALVLGIGRYEYAELQVTHDFDTVGEREVVLEGRVLREPDHRERTTHLVVDVHTLDAVPVLGRVLIFDERLSQVNYGDRVRVIGELGIPASFETDLGRTFAYHHYLRAQGIDRIVLYPTIEVEGTDEGSRVVSMLLRLKHELSQSLTTVLLSPESGLALGILLGEKQVLGQDMLRVFRDVGLIHIVVLSGYNIAIMIDALMRLISFVSLRTRALLGAVVIVLFVLMVGATATVLRAAVMALLVLLARATGRTYAILRALIVACVVMLLHNPYLLLFDPGFQLSVLATLGLILVAPLLENALKGAPQFHLVREYVISTMATQIMVLPLLMYSIGAVSTVALITNVLVLPVVPLAMLFAFLTSIAGSLSLSLGVVLGYPTDLILSYIIFISEWFSKVPYATLPAPKFSFVTMCVLYGVLGFGIALLLRTKKTAVKGVPSPREFPFA